MIIISTFCITSIGIHYLRVESYIVYPKGLKLIQRGPRQLGSLVGYRTKRSLAPPGDCSQTIFIAARCHAVIYLLRCL